MATTTANPFEELAEAANETTTDLRITVSTTLLVRDFHLPQQAWSTPDARMEILQQRLHEIWERAERIGLDHDYRFNAAWSEALAFAMSQRIMAVAAD
ncbi:MAG TPA: hypothetical protein VFW94_23600 [Candidatus Acidoferrales bacterium]|nr:hypothetical protein [Candidatus Acidoferrales bacterium]